MHIMKRLFGFRRGFGSLRHDICILQSLRDRSRRALYDAIRGAPIRVRGVVVVGVARRVDVPSVVRVASRRRPQPAVLRL